MKRLILPFIIAFVVACSSTKNNSAEEQEKHLCDSLKIEASIISQLRNYTSAKLEPFHYSISKELNHGTWNELDPIHLQGLVFKETSQNTELIFDKLNTIYKAKGYSVFVVERNFGLGDKDPDVMGILKTTDKYEILNLIQTNGINHDIDTDSLIKIIKIFDKKYSLELIGASGDWCEFKIKSNPTDWKNFADEAYKFCPDIVDQGTGTVEALAEELQRTKRLYFWWD